MAQRNFIDLTGQRFGRLTVIRRNYDRGRKDSLWDCRCDCGTMTIMRSSNLRSGKIVSCGCYKQENQRRRMHQIWQMAREHETL